MVSEERQPSLHGIWISRSSLDPSRDTPFRELETQLEQFAVNARRSPGRILGCAVKGGGPQRELNPPGNWFAPPGSNRSSGGGNEAAGACGGEGLAGELATMQAVT